MIAPPPPPAPPALTPPVSVFALTETRVSPERALFGGRPLRLRFSFRAPAALDVRVEIRLSGRTVRSWSLAGAAPGEPVRLGWYGRTSSGRPARDGRYRVRVGPAGGRLRAAGSFVLRGHVYPVRGSHWFRGPIGGFDAPRTGGRTHEGFDVNAACGSPIVAARAGMVLRSRYDPVLYGHHVIIRGRGERRVYWYAHLRGPARVSAGDRLLTGQRIGEVGATGNAVSVGCHLHFELHGPDGPFDPGPRLRLWDGWS